MINTMTKKLRERVDLRVVRCTSWAYQRIAQECAASPLSLAQAIDKLLRELDGLRAEMKPRLFQERQPAARRVASLAQPEPKMPAWCDEMHPAHGGFVAEYHCRKCGVWLTAYDLKDGVGCECHHKL